MEFDLLGDPIPANKGKPGANGHTPTAEKANKVRLLLVGGLTVERIAREMGLSAPTLRKHYFHNGKVSLRHARAMALAEARARNLLQLEAEAANGSVPAMKAIRAILDREEVLLADSDMTRRAPRRAEDRPARAPAPGKKQVARGAALEAEAELDLDWQKGARLN